MMRCFWGDLHHHNGVTYGKGSLERSIEIGRAHLDFCATTVHGGWHDIPEMPGGRQQIWKDGAARLEQNWAQIAARVNAADAPGRFVSILGYEWHSSEFGDYCLLYQRGDEPPVFPSQLTNLQAHANRLGGLLIPHHIAYSRGWRGGNFAHHDPTCSPVIEIYSEHGLSERDEGPYDYLRHTLGGRSTPNTVEHLLASGMRFGFVASTDTHFGFPGAYGEGIAGIWADSLSRDSLFDAIRARRTVAATGDRIDAWFELNGAAMGSELLHDPRRHIRVRVQGKGEIDRVEIVRVQPGRARSQAIHRVHPVDAPPVGFSAGPARCLVRIDYGWGPWSALKLDRVCDWSAGLVVDSGRLVCVTPCFGTAPFDENRRDVIEHRSESACRWSSFTGRENAFLDGGIKSMIFHVEGTAQTRLRLELQSPTVMRIETTLAELCQSNRIEFTGPFPAESIMLHRPVFDEHSSADFEFEERCDGPACYYARVAQTNGQMAWSSPVWVG